jgi:crotonobetainyl-CoA:carnitine CoA-transferase CaiB-like acyl-CoA transferase
VLPSGFRVGTAAAAAIAAAGLAAVELDRARTGRRQTVAVDMRHAAAECRSERYLRVDGEAPVDLWDDLAGTYPAADGRWLRLHTNFPHHREGIVEMLGGAADRRAVAAALARVDAAAFETAATDRGLCVAMMRRFDEWDAHPHAAAVAGEPLIRLARLDSAPPRPWPLGERPLQGFRVLEMTRVIAGPVAGRTLAAHGAEVLRVIGPHLPTIPSLDIDSGRGKRSAVADLRRPEDRARLQSVVGDGDVVLNAYRPGALDRFGLAPQALAARFPGLVIGTLSTYGRRGPWAGKRGFDSLVQTATGFNAAEAAATGSSAPKALPLQILDHASGHLLAAGVMAALRRQRSVGGSWHVEVSLARTAHWLRSLGRVDAGLATGELDEAVVADRLHVQPSPFGRLRAVRHAAELDVTPPRFDEAPAPFGQHPLTWATSSR